MSKVTWRYRNKWFWPQFSLWTGFCLLPMKRALRIVLLNTRSFNIRKSYLNFGKSIKYICEGIRL